MSKLVRILREAEISIHEDYEEVWSYNRLSRRQQKKLYNLAVLGFALTLESPAPLAKTTFNMGAWRYFGINPNYIVIATIALIAAYLYKSVKTNEVITLEVFLKELMWLLVAFIPSIILIAIGLGGF